MKQKEISDIIKKEIETISGKKLKSADENVFFRKNYIDSINLIGVIVYLETRFNVKIDAFFSDRKSVSSVRMLARLIKKKMDKKEKK